MERESLAELLGCGLSVEKIAKRFGKDPSTVSYWMAKHRLAAPNREKHMAKGGLEREALVSLVRQGLSLAKIAEALERSPATVRHWLETYDLETARTAKRRLSRSGRDAGNLRVHADCPTHGNTTFWLEGRGSYRCLKCRQESVVRRRRKVKEILVAEAGGGCAVCGYRRYLGALQFHHLNRADKSFSLSTLGVGRSLEKARAEAQKCVLLCSNCHAEVEAGLASVSGIARSGVAQLADALDC